MEKLAEHLKRIREAKTTKELESFCQAAWNDYPIKFGQNRTHNKIDRAIVGRGKELCNMHPKGDMVPQYRKRNRITVCNETYAVGYGGNSTGVRYARMAANRWVEKILLENGATEELAKNIANWWKRFPHRALQSIEKKWPTNMETGGRINE